MLPAGSIARASNVWLPSPSAGETVCGLEQLAHEPPSTRHWKVEPVSFELNRKTGDVAFDGSLGCASIVVSGVVLSTSRLATIEEGALLPATSVVTTRRSYRPSETPVVSQLAAYGAVVSVPIVVQVELPAGARWKTTCWTSDSESPALASRPTVARSGVPGFVSVLEGAPISTFAVTWAPAAWLPTLSDSTNVYR